MTAPASAPQTPPERPTPPDSTEAKEMLLSTRTYELLTGVRGEEGVDIAAIAEGLQRLSQLATEFPQIKEVDINPYMVGKRGVTPTAVDAMMALENGNKPATVAVTK